MSGEKLLEDPTNRIVAVLDDSTRTETARDDLVKDGLAENQIRLMIGQEAASKVDTSAKWFADTDDEIAKYQRELRAGRFVISVPVTDGDQRERIHTILKQHGARMITHFGEWVTEMMK